MFKVLVLISVFGAGLLAAEPASAHGFASATCSYITSVASNSISNIENAPVGAPTPLLASGLPSVIVLAGAAILFRRRRA